MEKAMKAWIYLGVFAATLGLAAPHPVWGEGPTAIFRNLPRPLQVPFEAHWYTETQNRHLKETLLRHERLLHEAASLLAQLPPPSSPIHPFRFPATHHDGAFALVLVLSDERLPTASRAKPPFALPDPLVDNFIPFGAGFPTQRPDGGTLIPLLAFLRLDLCDGLAKDPSAKQLGDDGLVPRYFASLYSLFYGRIAQEMEAPHALYGEQGRFNEYFLREMELSLRLIADFEFLISKASEAPAAIQSYLRKSYLPKLRTRQKWLEKEFKSRAKAEPGTDLYSATSVLPTERVGFFPEHLLDNRPRRTATQIRTIARSGLKLVEKLFSDLLPNSVFAWRSNYGLLRRKAFKPKLCLFSEWESRRPVGESEPDDEFFAFHIEKHRDGLFSTAVLTFFFDRIFLDPSTGELYPDAEIRWGLALARAYSGVLQAYLKAEPESLRGTDLLLQTDDFSRRLRNREFDAAGHLGALAWFGAMESLNKVPPSAEPMRVTEIQLLQNAQKCAARLLSAPLN